MRLLLKQQNTTGLTVGIYVTNSEFWATYAGRERTFKVSTLRVGDQTKVHVDVIRTDEVNQPVYITISGYKGMVSNDAWGQFT